jgi:hypothetical protein
MSERAGAVLTLAFFLLPSAAGAQAPPPPPPAAAPACPRPELQAFLPLLGSWNVQWTDRIAPGKYAEVKASARIEKDAIPCVLVEHFAGERNGRPFTALSLLSFGGEKLERVWIDSEHGQFIHFDGAATAEGAHYEWQRDLGNRRLMLKHEVRALQAGSFLTETHLSPDGGKTWDLVSRAKYSRQ